jgi:hypothetical protein
MALPTSENDGWQLAAEALREADEGKEDAVTDAECFICEEPAEPSVEVGFCKPAVRRRVRRHKAAQPLELIVLDDSDAEPEPELKTVSVQKSLRRRVILKRRFSPSKSPSSRGDPPCSLLRAWAQGWSSYQDSHAQEDSVGFDRGHNGERLKVDVEAAHRLIRFLTAPKPVHATHRGTDPYMQWLPCVEEPTKANMVTHKTPEPATGRRFKGRGASKFAVQGLSLNGFAHT